MRSPSAPLALLALCLLVPSIRLSAQTFKLPAITFAGAPAFSQADLLKVSDLHAGAISTQAEVQAAAQHLSDTGLFSDVHFESNAKGLVYTLKPMPSDNLLPASFSNFVWWTPDELTSALKARVPLYIGVVPISGNLQDSITATLKAMIVEKGVTATIVAMPISSQPGATPTSISFAIESPKFASTPSPWPRPHQPCNRSSRRSLKSRQANPSIFIPPPPSATRSPASTETPAISTLQSSISPQVTPTGIDLDLTVTIQEGEAYRVSQLTWQGSDIMSVADFNKQVRLKPEDIASQLALRQSLAPLARAYYSKGFQDARIQAPATFDRPTHHVSYNIHVVPGEQYRIHSVKTAGLSDVQVKQFDSAWHMNSGDFYDVNYLIDFLKQNSALQSLRGYSASYKAYSDPNTHLVDLVITFVKGGTLIQVD